MHKSGMGYRLISNELLDRGLYVDWSTVRRVIKKRQSEKGRDNTFSSHSDTILTRGLPEDQGNPSLTSESQG
jgi:hypothetical protein